MFLDVGRQVFGPDRLAAPPGTTRGRSGPAAGPDDARTVVAGQRRTGRAAKSHRSSRDGRVRPGSVGRTRRPSGLRRGPVSGCRQPTGRRAGEPGPERPYRSAFRVPKPTRAHATSLLFVSTPACRLRGRGPPILHDRLAANIIHD